MQILWGSITLTSSLWRQRSCPSGPWVMPPCLTLEQLPCFLSTWSCPLSAPRVYSRAPALLVGGQGWAEGQAGSLTPWKWTLLPHAPPSISIAPECPPQIPRALPALAISPLLTSPRAPLSPFLSLPLASSPHLWALSTPCCWCPMARHSLGWCLGQVAAHSPTPSALPVPLTDIPQHPTALPGGIFPWHHCGRTHLCAQSWCLALARPGGPGAGREGPPG